MNIALDGPAGAGKSSIAKLVAKKLSFVYLDTGAMYRTIALYVLKNQIAPSDEAAVVAKLDDIEITLSHKNGEQQIFLNGENVSKEIRKEEVGKTASVVAKYGKVREKLVSLQQKIASENDVIMDGRDIGTYVLPNAEVKIYQVASVEARAERRLKENQEKNIPCDLESLIKDIERRDYIDSHRDFAPLCKADDAILLDTSYMTIEEVVQEVLNIIATKVGNING